MEFQHKSFSFLFLDRLSEQAEIWDSITEQNRYWSSDYMNALVDFPPTGVTSLFCLVKKNDIVVAKFLFQYLDIRLKDSFGNSTTDQKRNVVLRKLRDWILPMLNFKLIVNGNLLLSGSYGFKFTNSLKIDDRLEVFQVANELIRKYLKTKGVKSQGILLKDLDNAHGNLDDFLAKEHYSHFKVQPKMKFIVREGWTSIDDYLAALKSKYRVRYRKAKKCLGAVEKRFLSSDEILKYSDQMYDLYNQTVSKAGFNLFLLNKNYFKDLAEKFPNTFRVNALFLEGKMVSFYTLMDNGSELDAHYLGYDLGMNGKYKLYLNMLYFMLEEAIVLNKKVLHMSRTALEIKSSVGTIPEEVQLYAKHYNNLFNRLAKSLLNLIVPKVEWEPRNPYK